MTDAAITYLIKRHPWMDYSQALALVVDSYNRFKDQKKYFGDHNVITLVNMDISIYGRTPENKMRDKLAALAEWS
jgi:hypothetical protein